MGGVTSTILIAAIGVLGTLASPIVTQRLSARVRRDEFEMQKSEKLDDRANETRQAALALRRSCYINLLESLRRYRHEIVNYFYALRKEKGNAPRDELDDARRAYVASFAEAQLTVSSRVLEMIHEYNIGLAIVYQIMRQLQDGTVRESDSNFKNPVTVVEELWGNWDVMRGIMREDIDITD